MTRRRKVAVAAVAAALAVAVACVLAAADRLLARPDRIAAAKREDHLASVSDELLRYEFDHGRLPPSLDDLVPHYLRRDQVEDEGRRLYRYDPARRVLALRERPVVRGLVSRRVDVPAVELPEPEPPASPRDSPRDEAAPVPRPAERVIVTLRRPGEPTRRGPGLRQAVARNKSEGLVVPAGPELPEPPEGSIVFEAEHYSEMNYGWEVRPDPGCGGGAYLHCKEGIANGVAQTEVRAGNFHDVHSTSDVTYLRYHLNLREAGRYWIYGRMWTTGTKCSNTVAAAVDTGGPYVGWMGNRTPFRWAWSAVQGSPFRLAAGDHFLHVFIHEDGLRVDQYVLSPRPLSGGEAFRANHLPGSGTAWAAGEGPSLHLTFDLKSMVMSPGLPPECSVVIRRLRMAEGEAELRAVLLDAGEAGEDILLARGTLDLAGLPEVGFLPLSFDGVDLAALARREYLLVAEMTSGGEALAKARAPLARPFTWEVAGPFGFLEIDDVGPLDGLRQAQPRRPEAKGDAAAGWRPFPERALDHFGVLDFGVALCGNSRHPTERATCYARTSVGAPEAGEYLFKVQADDQMLLWIDGELAYSHEFTRPVTRAAFTFTRRLERGEHGILMRVNNVEGPWQASLKIRTPDDGVSGGVGLPASARRR